MYSCNNFLDDLHEIGLSSTLYDILKDFLSNVLNDDPQDLLEYTRAYFAILYERSNEINVAGMNELLGLLSFSYRSHFLLLVKNSKFLSSPGKYRLGFRESSKTLPQQYFSSTTSAHTKTLPQQDFSSTTFAYTKFFM
ncbi:hypothetical protein GJ496_002149 [Pomphorhynchus laevis]|nr:hypothetical protein GJ496_002149 [Pomphorhynchus laevis]